MNNPHDDHHLVDFLRQHRPTPPPVAPDLEEQIFLATNYNPPKSPRQWLLPSALAASLFAMWGVYHIFLPPRSVQTASNLDAFVANNWNTTSENEPQPEWFDLVDIPSNK